MGRIMAIDHGSRRVGIAVSDPSGITAQPHSTLDARARDLVSTVAELVSELSVKTVVIGLPVGLNGTEGRSADAARRFGAKLARRSGVEIEFQDERFTSKMAERAMLEADMSRSARKEASDRVAAALILRAYLDRSQ